VFSPNQVGGGDRQSSSFSGRVFIEKKASPNEWQILVVDAKAVPFSWFLERISLMEEEYAC
jgi:hypothetical protein